MSILTRKATVAIVKMGTLEIEGLRFDDNGEFAIAQQQVASLFGLSTNNVTRDIKAILAEDSGLIKAKTNRNIGDAKNATFGKTAAKLCEDRSCKKDELRSTHSAASLVLIDRIEGHAVRLIDRGLEPLLAVSDAIDFYS
jgi:hypothetical protein